MDFLSITEQSIEAYKRQSAEYHLIAVAYFNLHRLVCEKSRNVLKNIPEDFNFYDLQGTEDYFGKKMERFVNLVLDPEFFKSGELSPDQIKNRKDFPLLIGVTALWVFLQEFQGTYYGQASYISLFFNPNPNASANANDPFDIKDKRCFDGLSTAYYSLHLIQALFFLFLDHPIMNVFFKKSEQENLFYEFEKRKDIVKAEATRVLCYWFPVDGIPKAFSPHCAGAAGTKKAMEKRIDALCDDLRKLIKPGDAKLSLNENTWLALIEKCTAKPRTDTGTITTYHKACEKILGVRIKIIK